MFFQDGLLLLNKQVVVAEILELAALKISGILKVPPETVTYSVEAEGDKLVPKFEVDKYAAEGVSERDIKEVVASVYDRVKIDLNVRMRAVGKTREQWQSEAAQA